MDFLSNKIWVRIFLGHPVHTSGAIFSFVEELKTVDFSNKFMVSFDVVSLFTNIPLKESIDLAVSYITEGNPSLRARDVSLSKTQKTSSTYRR